MDLLEDIQKVDEMIKSHERVNDSEFMLSQYKAKKIKLTGYLIDELAQVRSMASLAAILLLLYKFYPEIDREAERIKAQTKSKKSQSKEDEDLTRFVAALAV